MQALGAVFLLEKAHSIFFWIFQGLRKLVLVWLWIMLRYFMGVDIVWLIWPPFQTFTGLTCDSKALQLQITRDLSVQLFITVLCINVYCKIVYHCYWTTFERKLRVTSVCHFHSTDLQWVFAPKSTYYSHTHHASTPPLYFLQAGCPSGCQTNSVKALKAKVEYLSVFDPDLDLDFDWICVM